MSNEIKLIKQPMKTLIIYFNKMNHYYCCYGCARMYRKVEFKILSKKDLDDNRSDFYEHLF